MVDSLGKIKNIKVEILFDYGATNSFIFPYALEKCGLVAYEHDNFKEVEMVSRVKKVVGCSVDNFL
jgi:hypothetical protein